MASHSEIKFYTFLFVNYLVLPTFEIHIIMQKIIPTPIKFSEDFKAAIQKFADKKEFGNLSAVVKKATAKYIKYVEK